MSYFIGVVENGCGEAIACEAIEGFSIVHARHKLRTVCPHSYMLDYTIRWGLIAWIGARILSKRTDLLPHMRRYSNAGDPP